MVVKASLRLAAALASAVPASAALATGCASAGAPQAAVASRFSAMGLAFRYPGIWRSGT
jgi:acyl-coenzyme A synthetase/AMP-(fatty) acid ligase